MHVLWETIILWQVFIYNESFRLCLSECAPSILSSHLVCPRKGTTCQENGETLCQLRSLGSICRRHWWRISSCGKKVKKERNAAKRGDSETKGRCQWCQVKTPPMSPQWHFRQNTPVGRVKELTSLKSRWVWKNHYLAEVAKILVADRYISYGCCSMLVIQFCLRFLLISSSHCFPSCSLTGLVLFLTGDEG